MHTELTVRAVWGAALQRTGCAARGHFPVGKGEEKARGGKGQERGGLLGREEGDRAAESSGLGRAYSS